MKTVIDYVLVEEGRMNMVESMKIDDGGEGLADTTDHSWIEVAVGLEGGLGRGGRRLPIARWKIDRKTDWVKYRKELGKELDQWHKRLDEAGEIEGGMNDIGAIAYEKLIEAIRTAGERAVGRALVGRWVKPKKNRRLKRAIMKRNLAGRRWRRASGNNRANTERLWSEYRAKAKVVNGLKRRKQKKLNAQWLQNLLTEEKNGGKKLWQMIGKGKQREEIEVMQEEGKLVTDGNEIRRRVKEYFEKLGQSRRGVHVGRNAGGKVDVAAEGIFLQANCGE